MTCFAGAYQPSDGGVAVCLLCPVGQYQPHAHSDHCEQCPDEKTTRDEGAVTENDCKSDYLEMIKSGTCVFYYRASATRDSHIMSASSIGKAAPDISQDSATIFIYLFIYLLAYILTYILTYLLIYLFF